MSAPPTRGRTTVRIPTTEGEAHAHVHRAQGEPRGSLLLGHGTGGGSWGADLVLLTRLVEDGWTVVLVEQPWKVAGKGVGPAPASLDRAWADIERALRRRRVLVPGPWVLGGRSAGARVACRAAGTWAAAVAGPVRGRPRGAALAGVLALAFPLHPPGRPESSRAHEALGAVDAGVPVRVVQAERDPFGSPTELRVAFGDVVPVTAAAGDHSFTKDPQDVLVAAREALEAMLPR